LQGAQEPPQASPQGTLAFQAPTIPGHVQKAAFQQAGALALNGHGKSWYLNVSNTSGMMANFWAKHQTWPYNLKSGLGVSRNYHELVMVWQVEFEMEI